MYQTKIENKKDEGVLAALVTSLPWIGFSLPSFVLKPLLVMGTVGLFSTAVEANDVGSASEGSGSTEM